MSYDSSGNYLSKIELVNLNYGRFHWSNQN
jgi:hypothetical protein